MLYFIRAVGTDMVKVGFTEKDPNKRKGEIQTGCPFPLEVEATCKGSRADETDLQLALGGRRVREGGEWFYLSETEIMGITSQTFASPVKLRNKNKFDNLAGDLLLRVVKDFIKTNIPLADELIEISEFGKKILYISENIYELRNEIENNVKGEYDKLFSIERYRWLSRNSNPKPMLDVANIIGNNPLSKRKPGSRTDESEKYLESWVNRTVNRMNFNWQYRLTKNKPPPHRITENNNISGDINDLALTLGEILKKKNKKVHLDS